MTSLLQLAHRCRQIPQRFNTSFPSALFVLLVISTFLFAPSPQLRANRPSLISSLSLSFLFPLSFGSEQEPQSRSSFPDRPEYYVSDLDHHLGDSALKCLETLVIEHDRLTNQPFLIGITSQTLKVDLESYSRTLFSKWFASKRGQAQGILLFISVSDKKAQIVQGYGLDSLFPVPLKVEWIKHILFPFLSHKQVDIGILQITLQILKQLESPLILNNQADEITARYGFAFDSEKDFEAPSAWLWTLLVLLGSVAVSYILTNLLAKEAYFTSEGWLRPKPWEKWKWNHKTNDLGANDPQLEAVSDQW